ncbi:MAG: FKBP-type peptidyl-prolyl cis-trans isomerase [Bacteroidota bacterium]
MKKVLTIIAIVFFVSGFAQKPQVTPSAQASGKLNSASDSLQYTLGAYLGQYIITNSFAITNPALFKKGMDDVMFGKPLLVNADSVASMMNNYQKLTAVDRGRQQEKALFDNVKKQPGIGVLPSGVCYTIVKSGTGKRPQINDSIQLHLKGFLATGQLFEDTYPKNTPYNTSPGNVIAGMREILQIMPAGSLWRVYIPSALAFGEKGVTGLIAPYSALIYEVELLNVY